MVDYTMAGRTYRYTQHTPLYPFGYGLSYSRFGYFDLSVSPQSVKKGTDVTVIASVANSGPYDADEVRFSTRVLVMGQCTNTSS
jgi:beta-glucosidase